MMMKKKRWCLILECQPPPGEGYHVCEVRIQGLFLHFPITFISGSFQFREHQSDQKWQKVSRFFFKKISLLESQRKCLNGTFFYDN